MLSANPPTNAIGNPPPRAAFHASDPSSRGGRTGGCGGEFAILRPFAPQGKSDEWRVERRTFRPREAALGASRGCRRPPDGPRLVGVTWMWRLAFYPIASPPRKRIAGDGFDRCQACTIPARAAQCILRTAASAAWRRCGAERQRATRLRLERPAARRYGVPRCAPRWSGREGRRSEPQPPGSGWQPPMFAAAVVRLLMCVDTTSASRSTRFGSAHLHDERHYGHNCLSGERLASIGHGGRSSQGGIQRPPTR